MAVNDPTASNPADAPAKPAPWDTIDVLVALIQKAGFDEETTQNYTNIVLEGAGRQTGNGQPASPPAATPPQTAAQAVPTSAEATGTADKPADASTSASTPAANTPPDDAAARDARRRQLEDELAALNAQETADIAEVQTDEPPFQTQGVPQG